MDLTIKYYLDDFVREHSINRLVLGCTHYPLITENLNRIYPDIRGHQFFQRGGNGSAY